MPDNWERSTTFKKPWRYSKYASSYEYDGETYHIGYDSRYGRQSAAILDADGKVVLLLDPSEDEYEVACTLEAAEHIIKLANEEK